MSYGLQTYGDGLVVGVNGYGAFRAVNVVMYFVYNIVQVVICSGVIGGVVMQV